MVSIAPGRGTTRIRRAYGANRNKPQADEGHREVKWGVSLERAAVETTAVVKSDTIDYLSTLVWICARLKQQLRGREILASNGFNESRVAQTRLNRER